MTMINQSHSSERSLDEWLSYLENLHRTEIDLGLKRISMVAKRLHIDFSFAKVITVAGTNGKGTTCAFLENSLLAENYSVAVYSSPHIELFNERLRINKVDVEDSPLIQAFKKIELAREDISLTYYEYTTLAAFLVLMTEQPDVILLEVGLGGRLDATNLIDADVAVISSIDLDHQAFLGDTREKIGFEKAGIMRANRIAVVGDPNPPLSVIEHATSIKAKLITRGVDFYVEQANVNNEAITSWQWKNNECVLKHLKKPHIPLDNIATGLSVLHALEIELTSDKVNTVIEQTKVAGRTELFILANGTHVMLDVGHNPHATRYLASLLKGKGYNNIHAVVSMLQDKDITNSLLPLTDIVKQWYVGELSVPRAESANNIAKHLPKNSGKVNCFDNVTDAYKMATNNAEATDLVLVFGSFFTVSEIRRLHL